MSEQNSSGSGKIPKLQGAANYEIWAIRMEAILIKDGYYEMIQGNEMDISRPNDQSGQAWELWLIREGRQRSCAATIRLALADGPTLMTKATNNGTKLWQDLRNLYQATGFSSEFLTCRELFSTTLAKCNNSVETYVSKINKLTEELSARNLALPDRVIAAYILGNLTPDFESTVAILTQNIRANSTAVDLQHIYGYLLDESRRLKSKGGRSELAMASKAFQPKGKPKGNTPRCDHCKKTGHLKVSCWQLHPEKKKPKRKLGNKGKAYPDDSDSEIAAITMEFALSTRKSYVPQTWYLDSGASSHVSAYKEVFESLESCDIKLNWGSAGTISVKQRGNVKLEFSSTGKGITLRDCLYVPEIGMNLLSLGRLLKNNVLTHFTTTEVTLSYNQKVLAKGLNERNMLVFQTIAPEQALIAIDAQIWHQRMGHLGQNALKSLPKKVYGCEIKGDFDTSNCKICIQAKATAKTNREPSERATEYLEKVHSDICGPFQVMTWSKKKHFVSFIDDKTRYAHLALLATRDEIYSEFESWLTLEVNQSGVMLKRFHSDNAKEYKSETFTTLCKNRGIEQTFTAPYTPAQNGTAEIFNRTITGKMRAMLLESGLSSTWWGEAAQAACYIYNRTPHTGLSGNLTPYEARFGKKPNLSTIKQWGSRAYRKEPSEKLKKLDSRTSTWILVGYGSNQYKLANPTTHKTVMARDVYVTEGIFTTKDLERLTEQPLQLEDEYVDLSSSDGIAETPDNDQERVADYPPENLEDFVNEAEETPYQDTPTLDPQPEDTYMEENDPPVGGTSWSTFQDELQEWAMLAVEPTNINEVRASKDSKHWFQAMQKELDELNKQKTWDLVPLPPGKKALKGRWVMKLKELPSGNNLYKARWVAKGFQQRPGVDYTETFANTVQPVTYRILLAIGAYLDWEIQQWDIKSAYPNAPLHDEVYVVQPTGYEDAKYRDYVCKCNKALYGLKQAAREWQLHLKQLLAKLDFLPLKTDQGVFTRTRNSVTVILVTYVDDILVMATSQTQINEVRQSLGKDLEIKDLGAVNTFLGIKITRNRVKRSITLSQGAYTKKILSRAGRPHKPSSNRTVPVKLSTRLEANNDQATPEAIYQYQQDIGSLMYLMCKTRVDLTYPVGMLARFMGNPSISHRQALDQVWNYLQTSPILGIKYQSKSLQAIGYSDSDWGGDLESRKSTSGYIWTLGSGAIAWNSRLQKTVALSSCEAEYMALREAVKEQLYIGQVIQELPIPQPKPAWNQLYGDNQSSIELAKDPKHHARTKHMDIHYHFVRDHVQGGMTKLDYIPTEQQLADPLTKAVDRQKIDRFLSEIGLCHL